MSELLTILLVGKIGQLGWHFARLLPTLGAVHAVDKEEIDLVRPEGLREIIRSIKPKLIVNASAYTAVDQAEKEPDVAMAINGTAPGVMAEEAVRLGALLIHYSTDYVFDGTKSSAYVESDSPNPLNAYGRSKLAGENAVQRVGGPHLIFRTSWLYETRGKNFLLTMLRLAREREELRVVDDQFGAPTRARDVAEATIKVVTDWQRNGLDGRYGLHHMTNSGRTSWHGFTETIVDEFRSQSVDGSQLAVRRVVPIPAREYPLPAARPANSSLDCGKLNRDFGLQLVDWRDALRAAIADLVQVRD